jgi:hypothetical protein
MPELFSVYGMVFVINEVDVFLLFLSRLNFTQGKPPSGHGMEE